MDIFIIILKLIIVIAIIVLLIGLNLALFLIFPLKTRHKWVIGWEEKKGLISKKWLNEIQKQEIWIKSPYKYDLYGEYIKNNVESNKTVVIVHGYRFNFIGSIKYGKMFLDMGYNVFWFDNCRSGKSKGRTVTMGYREKNDLKEVIKYLRENICKNHLIGIHGESMGASLSLMYGAEDEKLSFIIEDCGYSDLCDELKHHIKNSLHLPLTPFIQISSFFVRILGKFKIEEVSPLNLLKQDNALSKIPILFIHGGEDKFTPTFMVNDMYNAKKGEKSLYICDNAGHAQSFFKNKEKYKDEVRQFIEKTSFKS